VAHLEAILRAYLDDLNAPTEKLLFPSLNPLSSIGTIRAELGRQIACEGQRPYRIGGRV
jgi:hypothetical protein